MEADYQSLYLSLFTAADTITSYQISFSFRVNIINHSDVFETNYIIKLIQWIKNSHVNENIYCESFERNTV